MDAVWAVYKRDFKVTLQQVNLFAQVLTFVVSDSLQTIQNKLKNKGLIITAIVFFLLVNTTYYWEGKLGHWAFPAFFLFVGIYFALSIALLRQLSLVIREKFKDKQRIFIVAILTTVLVVTFIWPNGLIDFESMEGNDILVAQQEGAANCMTIFKLKENNRFKEVSACFGVTEIKGNYKLRNDTIYFENVEPGRNENEFFKFAVIKLSKFNNDKNAFDLVRYKDFNDTTGHGLLITKNELFKQTDKKPNR